jgi:hypothetical protein
MTAVTHIAGLDVTVNDRLRQRCAWCGATLIDEDVARVQRPIGLNEIVPRWPIGELVVVDGRASWTIPYSDDDPIPDDACASLDPDVTV